MSDQEDQELIRETIETIQKQIDYLEQTQPPEWQKAIRGLRKAIAKLRRKLN